MLHLGEPVIITRDDHAYYGCVGYVERQISENFYAVRVFVPFFSRYNAEAVILTPGDVATLSALAPLTPDSTREILREIEHEMPPSGTVHITNNATICAKRCLVDPSVEYITEEQ